MADIVVLGSINMDLVIRSPRMPLPGETIRGRGFATVPGGKGANQAAAAAHMGASVQMVGCVGQDAFGPDLINNLASQNVDTSLIRRCADEASGIAMIIVDDNGENSIVVAPGANHALEEQDIERVRAELQEASYLVMQLEIPLSIASQAITAAKDLGLPVILNAAPATEVPPELLQGIFCVMVNESEAETITGTRVDSPDDARQVCDALLEMGIEIAIVTLGPDGAVFASKDGCHHMPGIKVDAIDTTAAGDTFAGAFAVALLEGKPLDTAVMYANCAGALATTVLGAQTSIPKRPDVDALFEQMKA